MYHLTKTNCALHCLYPPVMVASNIDRINIVGVVVGDKVTADRIIEKELCVWTRILDGGQVLPVVEQIRLRADHDAGPFWLWRF